MAKTWLAQHKRHPKIKVELTDAEASEYRTKRNLKNAYTLTEIQPREKAAEPTEAKRAEVAKATDAENKRG